MRRVRLSLNFVEEFSAMLETGIDRFGPRVAERTSHRVRTAIEYLGRHPNRARDPELGVVIYSVDRTPFALLYDFDDDELRILLVVYARADRTAIDLADVRW